MPRDVELFFAHHDRCGGVEVRTGPPTSALGYYLALTCRCGGFRIKWVMAQDALFNLVRSTQPSTRERRPGSEPLALICAEPPCRSRARGSARGGGMRRCVSEARAKRAMNRALHRSDRRC